MLHLNKVMYPESDPQIASIHRTLSDMFARLPASQAQLGQRYQQQAPVLIERLRRLYGDQPDFSGWVQQLMRAVLEIATERPDALQELDQQREQNKNWFTDQHMLGYCTYVDQFAGNLRGVIEKIPHLSELGVAYLHLLPFLKGRAGESDGGFAVASYDEIEPHYGDMQDLLALTEQLRAAKISLCSDFILNHVADDHPWAIAAKQGDSAYQRYFYSFADRTMPDQYEQTVGQIFPQAAPGNFTFIESLQRWVWTTFYPFQWDLNYQNPTVFLEMVKALLRLANRGIEVFRLDSTAFLWKRPGTNCMNQPEAHWILQAIRSLVDIAAPGVLLKAEAIVPTADLPAYLGVKALGTQAQVNECHLAYHSSLMSAGWVALAEQNTEVIQRVMAATPVLPEHASWLTYVRCHDDIGWNVLRQELTATNGMTVQQRLSAVSRFYAGEDQSYARGASFQAADPSAVHGTVGMASALCGYASATDAHELALAQRRMLLLYGLALSFGGLPVIYMGDELALPNDETYVLYKDKAHDSRWLHRGGFDEESFAMRYVSDTNAGNMFAALRHLIRCRQQLPQLATTQERRAIASADHALLIFSRGSEARQEAVLVIANFSERTVPLNLDQVNIAIDGVWQDVLTGTRYGQETGTELRLQPYAQVWLRRADAPIATTATVLNADTNTATNTVITTTAGDA